MPAARSRPGGPVVRRQPGHRRRTRVGKSRPAAGVSHRPHRRCWAEAVAGRSTVDAAWWAELDHPVAVDVAEDAAGSRPSPGPILRNQRRRRGRVRCDSIAVAISSLREVAPTVVTSRSMTASSASVAFIVQSTRRSPATDAAARGERWRAGNRDPGRPGPVRRAVIRAGSCAIVASIASSATSALVRRSPRTLRAAATAAGVR